MCGSVSPFEFVYYANAASFHYKSLEDLIELSRVVEWKNANDLKFN